MLSRLDQLLPRRNWRTLPREWEVICNDFGGKLNRKEIVCEIIASIKERKKKSANRRGKVFLSKIIESREIFSFLNLKLFG